MCYSQTSARDQACVNMQKAGAILGSEIKEKQKVFTTHTDTGPSRPGWGIQGTNWS